MSPETQQEQSLGQSTDQHPTKAQPSQEKDVMNTDGKSQNPDKCDAIKILVAGMVAGTDEDIPEGMYKSGGICFLLGKRLTAPEPDTWSYPCGLLKNGELIFDCANRIVKEQTGLEVNAEEIIRTTQNFIEGAHYITFFVFCGFPKGEYPSGKVWNHDSQWAEWHWDAEERHFHAKDMIKGKKPSKVLFAPLVNLWDETKTRYIDWDREPGIDL
ncbi:hypothetical protein F5Y16DRAFT_358300 [Xylariaceae sp. FL0255]|nr:hypothetical protein F5Y16DRAFT_358300 [Xylariaceae sp. FL0255]